MRTNLLPAILIAGPPHSGKSVLAFLLTQKLREMGISHYLLRAAPDGEGNWFHIGKSHQVRSLRQKHKGDYSTEFVGLVRTIVEKRHLPLLVDIGGRPQGDQFSILRACTHSILLYRTEEDRVTWESYLSGMDLLPIAELRSELYGTDTISEIHPILQGVITRLDRQDAQMGSSFGALLDRTAGICHYTETELEKIHARQAPYPVLFERQLAEKIDVLREGKRLVWKPEDLAKLPGLVQANSPRAIYGPGPVWLAGMLAGHLSTAPMSIFDARFGWLELPEVYFSEDANVKVQINDWLEQDAQCVSIRLPEVEIEPDKICLPPIKGKNGLVLSGVLPRWFFAALARAFMKDRAWIGIDEPAKERVVVISSNYPSKNIGDAIPRSQALFFSTLE